MAPPPARAGHAAAFIGCSRSVSQVDGCGGFDQPHMNESYALIGQFLQAAAKKHGRKVVYHWRFFNDVQDSWASVAGIINEIGAGQPTCRPGPLVSEPVTARACATADSMRRTADSTRCAWRALH
jgi:hypothetical protein